MTTQDALTALNISDLRRLHETLNAHGLRGRGTHTSDGNLTEAAEALVQTLCGGCADVRGSAGEPVSPTLPTVGDTFTPSADPVHVSMWTQEIDRLGAEVDRLSAYALDCDAILREMVQTITRLEQERQAVAAPVRRPTVSFGSVVGFVRRYLLTPAAPVVQARVVPEFAETQVFYGSSLRRAEG